jgi:hypothetical protein
MGALRTSSRPRSSGCGVLLSGGATLSFLLTSSEVRCDGEGEEACFFRFGMLDLADRFPAMAFLHFLNR